MSSRSRGKGLIVAAVAALAGLGAPPSAFADPSLGLEMARTTTPLNRGDERLVYELTVSNTASASPSSGDELTCSGTPADGHAWAGNPTPTFAYRWLRDGIPIGGETSGTYTLTAADEGRAVQCAVTATNDADGGGSLYAPVSTTYASAPVGVEPQPVAPPNGDSRPLTSPTIVLAAPTGTASTVAGSSVLTNVVTATGTGTLAAGSKLVTDVVTNSGVFTAGVEFGPQQEVTGAGIPADTVVAKIISPTEFELSQAATASATGVALSAGALPFQQGQEVSGSGIPAGATITNGEGQTLTLSGPATSTASGVVVNGISKQTCDVPSGWTGTGLTWSFRWLRNGEPIPGANSATYVVQKADTEPPSVLQCEATATDANGRKAVTMSLAQATRPLPPPPYLSPQSSEDPSIGFANQSAGEVTLEIDAPHGEGIHIFKAVSPGNGWSCVKQAPTPLQAAHATCKRADSLPPGDSFPPVEVVIALGKNPPDLLTTKARLSGGGSPAPPELEDGFTIGPAIPWGFAAFETKVADELGGDYAQAGGHPFSAFAKLKFTEHVRAEKTAEAGFRAANGHLRVVKTDVPEGFVGNPKAPPEDCLKIADVVRFPGPTACPLGSVVGGVTVDTYQDTFENQPIYSIVPERGAPAEFAFGIARVGAAFALVPELVPDKRYAIRLLTAPAPKFPEVFGAEVTLCGFGAKLTLEDDESKFAGCKTAGEAGNAVPLLTNPTRCAGPPPVTRIAADTWEEPGAFAEAASVGPAITGCEDVPFSPSASLRPTSRQADSPTGLEVSVRMPTDGLLSIPGIAQSALKRAVVTLPEEMSVNTAAADGLAACGSEQIALGTNDPARCPDASKIASALVRSPLLEEPLHGSLYLAKQGDNPFGSLLAVYLVVGSSERGILVKLPGEVRPSASGRLTTVFDENPQVPFESIELRFIEGERAPLINPPSCGTYGIDHELAPWSAGDPSAPTPAELESATSSFKVTRGPGDGPCLANALAPVLRAGVTNPVAGAKSPFVLSLSREDGSQRFTAVEVKMPPGLSARLKGVPYCPDTVLASIPSAEGTGAKELAAPSCPEASQVGSVSVGVGAGPNPLYVATGRAYLAGPYKGAPLSLAIVTPAVTGPFDLGNVVVRTALRVNPATAEITAVSDPIPTILKGIRLNVRDIRVRIDRPNFVVNPTSCEAKAVSVRVSGDQGGDALASDRFQVGRCDRLKFKPNLKLRLRGRTTRGAYQRLIATLTAKPGEANIARASVTLPHSLFLAQEHIGTICTRVQFAAEKCPAGSVYGRATAVTPLLGYPLKGPVYLRSSDNPLPDLVAALRGPASQPIEVELAGRTDSKNRGIRNTFDVIPDAPVTKFRLELKGGKKSLVVSSRNLCAGVQRATVRMRAQNGKTRNFRPVVQNDCPEKKRKSKKR